LLIYRKKGDAIKVIDFRGALRKYFDDLDLDLPFLRGLPPVRAIELRGVERQLYLFCTETRTLEEVLSHFGKNPTEARRVLAIIESWYAARLVFREGNRVLALAVAETRAQAVARIRQPDLPQTASGRERKRLAVVA
jgi:hypothetical protein